MKLTPAQKKTLATIMDNGGGLSEDDRKGFKIQPKMLDKLKDDGLVRWAPTGGPSKKGWWRLTPDGRKAAKEQAAA